MTHWITAVALAALAASCGDYNKVLKSTDPAYKLDRAIQYFDTKNYSKAYPLFDELMTSYRGTTKAQTVYRYFARTLYAQREYILASYHFKRFAQTFPSDEFAEEAAYLGAHCAYLDAPSTTLDPALTYQAMDELQLFINTHPDSKFLGEANTQIDELRRRLEEKSFLIAKGYHHRNQYASAVVSFNVMLTDHPASPRREEAMYYRIESAMKYAENSIESKQEERFREATTYVNEYQATFPDGSYASDVSGFAKRIAARNRK
ncbi:MAG: outer membrane protein assembly factor BamD [Bacteroidota bacterium]